MLCFDSLKIGEWIAKELDMIFTPEKSSCIGLLKNGELIAGVWYEDYTKESIMAHIVIKERINREFLTTIFHYPFVQLGVSKIIGPVKSTNAKAIEFDKKLGFTEEARLLGVFPDADLLFFTMAKSDCRFLGERYGQVS
jgi:RimJ/RimL family protein N-acetyltransferase